MVQIQEYNLPDELYFSGEHSYAKVENGKVRVGMSDFFAKTAGSIVYVDLPFEGDEVESGEVCGKIQSRKWIGKLVAPISGEIVEINEAINDDSTLINSDPYGDGWLVVIEPSHLEEDLAKLIHGPDAVKQWIDGELKKAEAEKAKHAGEEG
jgi:glycine cleavage system H protein